MAKKNVNHRTNNRNQNTVDVWGSTGTTMTHTTKLVSVCRYPETGTRNILIFWPKTSRVRSVFIPGEADRANDWERNVEDFDVNDDAAQEPLLHHFGGVVKQIIAAL